MLAKRKRSGKGTLAGRVVPPGHDPVTAPQHYTAHPSGVECITIARHMSFALGNALKYIWRAGRKVESAAAEIQDLRKARWYLADRITQLGGVP